MTLLQFIQDQKLTTEAFAQAVGISQPYAWRLVHSDEKRPSPLLALKIETWTKGAVKAADLNPLIAEIKAMPKRRARSAA